MARIAGVDLPKEKRVEIVTKITYTYEDGSTREVVQTQKHSFK